MFKEQSKRLNKLSRDMDLYNSKRQLEILERKVTMSLMENIFRINGRLDTEKEKTSKLEDTTIKTIMKYRETKD